MKKLGLIGGTGPESTLLYYKKINYAVHEKNSGTEFPEIVIESIDLHKVVKYIQNKEYDKLTEYVMSKVSNLVSCGAEVISLTAVTMHIIYDKLIQKSGLPLVSIPEALSEEAEKKGYSKVGLLGTIFTMDNDYMKQPLEKRGISVVIPNPENKKLVADKIANELEYGIVKDSTLKDFLDVISRMTDSDGIQAVILGCTELPLILNSDVCPVECLDAVDIHIRKLVDML